MTVRILVVQLSESYPPGRLADWFEAAGGQCDLVDGAQCPSWDDLEDHAGIVVLGGEMHAADDIAHPWLSGVRRLLSSAVSHELPVLAIGLGAQLLAMATGGQVRAGKQGPEAGTLLIAKRDAAAEDVLFGSVPLTPDVVQFHRDVVTNLPPTAVLLASSPKYPNQAFRVGACAYGVQFHMETTAEIVAEWGRVDEELAEHVRPAQWEPEHLSEFHVELADVWRPWAERFVELAGTPPEQRRESRFLPLL